MSDIDKITNAELNGKGVRGLPDTPGLTTTDMQNKLDEIAVDVLIPKVNELVENANETNATLGKTDISDIGDGTVTGALDEINSNFSDAIDVTPINAYSYIQRVIRIGAVAFVNIDYTAGVSLALASVIYQGLPTPYYDIAIPMTIIRGGSSIASVAFINKSGDIQVGVPLEYQDRIIINACYVCVI